MDFLKHVHLQVLSFLYLSHAWLVVDRMISKTTDDEQMNFVNCTLLTTHTHTHITLSHHCIQQPLHIPGNENLNKFQLFAACLSIPRRICVWIAHHIWNCIWKTHSQKDRSTYAACMTALDLFFTLIIARKGYVKKLAIWKRQRTVYREADTWQEK